MAQVLDEGKFEARKLTYSRKLLSRDYGKGLWGTYVDVFNMTTKKGAQVKALKILKGEGDVISWLSKNRDKVARTIGVEIDATSLPKGAVIVLSDKKMGNRMGRSVPVDVHMAYFVLKIKDPATGKRISFLAEMVNEVRSQDGYQLGTLAKVGIALRKYLLDPSEVENKFNILDTDQMAKDIENVLNAEKKQIGGAFSVQKKFIGERVESVIFNGNDDFFLELYPVDTKTGEIVGGSWSVFPRPDEVVYA